MTLQPFSPKGFSLLATLWCVLGVSLWPLWYLGQGILPLYPTELHARLMIQGFVGFMMLGFLAQNPLKSFFSAGRTSKIVGCLTGALVTAFAVGQLSWRFGWGDSAFAALLLLFLYGLWQERRQIPKVEWILWSAALISGGIGSLLPVLQAALPANLSTHTVSLHHLGLFQLFPAFGLLAAWPKSEKPSLKPTTLMLWILLVWGLSLLEASNAQAWTHWLRWALLLGLIKGLGLTVSSHKSPRSRVQTVLGWSLVWVVWWVAFRPWYLAQQAALSHAWLMGGAGFLWMTLLVSRHTEMGSVTTLSHRAWRWWLALVALAIMTRLTPVWVPSTTMSHHIYAALTWVAILGIWWRWLSRFTHQNVEQKFGRDDSLRE